MKELLYLFFISLVFSSCAHEEEYYSDINKLKTAISNNDINLNKKISFNNFSIEVSYRPAEILALMQNPDISDSALNQVTYENKNKAYFVLKFYTDSISTLDFLKEKYIENYDSIHKNILFDFQKAFVLLEGEKQHPCAFYQVEQTGNITPAMTFDLTFDRSHSEINSDWKLIFNDSIISDHRWIATFTEGELKQIPKFKSKK